jgi:hypothetical protein
MNSFKANGSMNSMIEIFGGLMRQNYFVAAIQSYLGYLEKERERNSARAWEAEQKRRRASLEGGPNVGMDEPR